MKHSIAYFVFSIIILLYSCNKQRYESGIVINSDSVIELRWNYIIDENECDNPKYPSNISFSIIVDSDSLRFFANHVDYAMDYRSPMNARDLDTLAMVIKGAIVYKNIYSELYSKNCIVKCDLLQLSGHLANNIINYVLTRSPFLPDIDETKFRPLPKENPFFNKQDTVTWDSLSIKQGPELRPDGEWWAINYQISSSGESALFNGKNIFDLERRAVTNRCSQRKIFLTKEEISKINKILYKCNPKGYFLYIDKFPGDAIPVIYSIDNKEFMRSYAIDPDFQTQYSDLINQKAFLRYE